MKNTHIFWYGFFAGIVITTLMVITPVKADTISSGSIAVLGGRSASNFITDSKATSWEVEERTTRWNFGYLNEGHRMWEKRDGIYAMRSFHNRLSDRVDTSFDIGPYFTATTVTEPDGIHYYDHYRWDGLASASLEIKATEELALIGRWSHVIYSQNHDADIFLFGLDYNPQGW